MHHRLYLQVIYGTAIAPVNSPYNFSPLAPLAAGLAIYVAIEASGDFTGSPLNPARVIGPALVFFCNWRHFWAWTLGKISLFLNKSYSHLAVSCQEVSRNLRYSSTGE